MGVSVLPFLNLKARAVENLAPDQSDDSMWEKDDDDLWRSPTKSTPVRGSNDLLEEFEEAASDGGIQSLALGALDNSFLVNDSSVQVVKNFSHGILVNHISLTFSFERSNLVKTISPDFTPPDSSITQQLYDGSPSSWTVSW